MGQGRDGQRGDGARAREGERFRLSAYPPAGRWVAAALLLVAGASVPLILAAVLFASDPPITPPVLARSFAALTLAPALGAWLLHRAFRLEAEVGAGGLVLAGRGLRIEIPTAAVERAVAWAIPVPGAGFSLRLRSGRRFRYGLCAREPGRFLRALEERAGVAAGAAAAHPAIRYADAKATNHPWRWYHGALKFPLFALLPTAVLFNAHQYIAYGGTLGQYYREGLAPYLATFAWYWVTLVIYLLLYAAAWRGVAEAIAFAAAWRGAAPAVAARRAVERACSVAYYGGVPVLLALRFAG
jgi:hypothetical protein